MEHLSGGDMLSRLSNGPLPENRAKGVLYQILQGVNYLHRCGISHRDLKLENFLFVSKHSWDIKLIDFGLSNIFVGKQNNAMMSQVGTTLYAAPEVFDGKYTEKCDSWSIGVLMYILLSGQPPFTGTHNHQVIN